jgi:hypothetical protein
MRHTLMNYFLIFSVRFYREIPRLPTLLQHSRYPEYVTLLRNIQWCVSYIPSVLIGAVISGLSNISSSKLNMHSIFKGRGNLRVFWIMLSSISTKTCEYSQIPALYKNREYRSFGRSYKSKYLYAIKTESINNIGGVLFLNIPQYPHFSL